LEGGRSVVLPLKNSDIGKYVDPNSSRRLAREFEKDTLLTVKVLLQAILATFFVVMDRAVYEILSIIARNSLISFDQEGSHNLNVTVKGTGYLANVIRKASEDFNVSERVKVVLTNEPCLPRPSKTEPWKIIQIYLLFILNLYLIYNQVYIHRSKRFVCSYFYPEREKKRVLYLYNKMLKRRKNSFNSTVQRVKEKLKVDGKVKQEHNFFQVIYVMERRHV
jgi:E3 ubiquitin-protein ligase DCST1